MAKSLYDGTVSLESVTHDINTRSDADNHSALLSFIGRNNRRFSAGDGFYAWRDLRYVLYEYEYSLGEQNHLQKIDWRLFSSTEKDRFSIEHIFPQTPTVWYWRNQFRQYSDIEKRILAGSLGNLLPLSQSINAALQNDSFDDKKHSKTGLRGYDHGSHSEIEVSKESDWDAERIFERGMRLLAFIEKRWNVSFEGDEQKMDILHLGFVFDGREVPPSIPISTTKEQTEDVGTIRERYWTYALPIIQKAHVATGCFSKCSPTNDNYVDGFFGIRGFNLYCGVSRDGIKVALWLGREKEENKAAFDYLFAYKDPIEQALGVPINWERRDGMKSSGVTYHINNIDIRNESNWVQMAEFHAIWSKKFYDVFLPLLKQLVEEH